MTANIYPLGHISIGVRDITTSKTFYSAALAPLDLRLMYDGHPSRILGYGQDEDNELLNIFQHADAREPAPGFHLEFNAPTRGAVEEFYAAAIQNGGTGDGAPGLRERYGSDYFATFFVDPEGWRLEAVCKSNGGVIGSSIDGAGERNG
jgi:catechol 2,3-dioxygenase-like lactoylglutathione lyase family enzyme